MSGRLIQPPWTYSPSLDGDFIYHSSTDQIVLKSGRRYQRPQSLPVNSLRTASYDGPLPFEGTGPADYTLEPGRSRAFSAPESQGDRLKDDIKPFQLPLLPSTPRQLPQSIDRFALQSTPIVFDGKTAGSLNANRELRPEGSPQLPRAPRGTHIYLAKQSGQKQRGEPAKRPDASARRVLVNDDAYLAQVFSTFSARKRSPDDVGKIIVIIRSASMAGSSLAPLYIQGVNPSGAGETVFAQADRYVIIHPGSASDPHFTALPIRTYGGRGVAAPGVIKSHHCIIFSSRSAPEPTVQEQATRATDSMRRPPIRVDLDNPTDSLDPMSRVHLKRATRISNCERIREIGRVSKQSEVYLLNHFSNAQRDNQSLPETTTPATPLSRPPLSRPPLPTPSYSRQRPAARLRLPEEDDDDEEDDDEEDDDEEDDDEEDDDEAVDDDDGDAEVEEEDSESE